MYRERRALRIDESPSLGKVLAVHGEVMRVLHHDHRHLQHCAYNESINVASSGPFKAISTLLFGGMRQDFLQVYAWHYTSFCKSLEAKVMKKDATPLNVV